MVLAAIGFLTLSACSGQSRWSSADVFYVAQDGDRVVLMGIDVDSADPSPVEVTEVGTTTEIVAATVSHGVGGPHVLVSRSDGTRQVRAVNAATQQVSEGTSVPDYGTVTRVPGGFATTTPEVAGPVRVQLRTDDGKLPLDVGPLGIHPITMAATSGGFVVVGSTSDAGTVMQHAGRDGKVRSPVVLAADSLPGQIATEGETIAVALNRSIPEGASSNAKATLPADQRLAVVVPGSPVRFLDVGESPNHLASAGGGQFVLDSIVDGQRVIQLVSAEGKARVLAKLGDPGPVLGLAIVKDHVFALQTSAVHMVGLGQSSGSEETVVDLTLDAYSEWVAPG
jgi:hypothetical protein